MDKYLAFDVETGGLSPTKSSLLTAYFAILDENFNALDELELAIKNDDENEQYHVSPKALQVNKINLVDHHYSPNSVTKDTAKLKLLDFLVKGSENGSIRLIPLGHNIMNFDVPFVNEHLIPKSIWDKYVGYRAADTASFAIFLQKVKKVIPAGVRGDLKSLAKHFGINTENGSLHTAKFDTIVAVALLEKMRGA